MLDKTSKAFLDYLDAFPNDELWMTEGYEIPDRFGEEDAFWAMIRFLENEGYIEPLQSDSGISFGSRLSHKGIHRTEFHRAEILQYIKEKWIDFFSMAVSLAALILSITALLK